MAAMWQRRIRAGSWSVFLLILGAFLTDFPESTAHAGFLKNGARPGNKRIQTIKPPRPGARKRIYKPGERPAAPVRNSARGSSGRQRHAWFWRTYSTALASADPGRWDLALETMAKRRGEKRGLVRDETMAAIWAAYQTQIRRSARANNLSETLVLGVIAVESRGQPLARSPKNAQGLMQLIPATAKRFGVADPLQPAQNIAGGAAYLNWLLKEFRGDPLLALAGYNAGEGAVRRHKGVPPYSETRDYVVKVMDAVAAAARLCGATPSSPRSACPGAQPAPAG